MRWRELSFSHADMRNSSQGIDPDSLWNPFNFCISASTVRPLALSTRKKTRKQGMNSNQKAQSLPRGGVIRPSSLPGYSPANHHGTTNVRLVGPANGARHMEVILGDIEAGGSALAHAHPGLEQAAYVLEGTAVVGIDGQEMDVRPGDLMFFPEGIFHSIRVTSDRIKLLVIYSPPYGEDPSKVIR